MSALEVRTAEWHAERRKGIGASDVPAIAGLSPYAKPIDVWQEKVGLVEPEPENPATRWGSLLEPVVADEFAAQTGRKIRRWGRAVRYRDWPVLFAHLDRQVIGGGILEVKTAMSTRGWGEPGSADVPDHVALQVQAQLACADQEVAFVAALVGYRDFRVYELPRDRALFEDAVLPLLREFWTLVESQTPPEADGSDEYGRFLRSKYPTDAGTERAATPEEQLVGLAFVEARGARIAAELREEEAEQRLQAAMTTATRLDGPGWYATWKQSKDRTTTDWKLVAESYRIAIERELAMVAAGDAAGAGLPSRDDLDAIQSLYTETKPGPRPFRFVVQSTEEGKE